MSDTFNTFNFDVFRDIKPEQRGEAIAEIVTSFVNASCNQSNEAFTKAIMRSHRTLQQLVFNTFLQLVSKWAEAENNENFDARNEFTVKTSKKIQDMFEENYGSGSLRAPFI